MIPVVALCDLTHHGVSYTAGDRLDVSPIEAAALTYRKLARFADKHLKAETPKKRSRRTYRRRDMVAEP